MSDVTILTEARYKLVRSDEYLTEAGINFDDMTVLSRAQG